MNRIERLQSLAESLRRAGSGGRTARQLADAFGVSGRTIKRDLAALEASGLPIWSRTGPGGGYGVSERATMPTVNLTPAQALALNTAVAMSPGAPFSDAARAAANKVLDVLDPVARRRAAELSRRIWVDIEPGAPRRIMSALERALIDQVTVNIDYLDGDGNHTRREVEPMIFAFTDGRWLMVAWCRLRGGIRWFRLSRIKRATATRTQCSARDIGDIGVPPVSARPVH